MKGAGNKGFSENLTPSFITKSRRNYYFAVIWMIMSKRVRILRKKKEMEIDEF